MVLLNYQPPITPYLTLLHRDEDVLVLAKPSGLLSVKGRAEQHLIATNSYTASFSHRLCRAPLRHGHQWHYFNGA